MSNPRSLILSIGEVMIEMTRGSDGRFRQTCAGDTFNTAVYLARRGLPVAFASALGDDPYSDQILTLAASEGIATELVSRVPGRLPGLCLVETTPAGDRIPHFWREGSPACQLFELPNWGRIAEAMIGARIVYFSGITLSIYSNMGLGRFLAVLEAARASRRQSGVRRQLSPPRLARRHSANAQSFHGSAEARRYRASNLQ